MSLLLTLLTANAAPETSPLEAAYQREYAYLQAERQALLDQQAQLEREAGTRIQRAEQALATAQADVLGMAARRDAVEDDLFQTSRAQESRDLAVDRVDGTLVRAAASLPGFEVPQGDTPEAQATAFGAVLAEADRRLADGRRVHEAPGAWFGTDGSRATGTIRHYGRIAAEGIDAGPLAPAGEGRWIRVEGDGTFLFEGTAKNATPEPEKTWSDQLEAGGVVGFVILALGFVGVLLAGFRVLSMAIARGGALRRVREAVLAGPKVRELMEDRAAEAILRETPAIQRFGSAILVIAAVAPLLGLLGTVTGMIGTFDILTEFGTGDPRMLSGGISEALVTTQLGLVVAIPMLLIGNLLDRAGSNLLDRLETEALHAMNAAETRPPPADQLAAK